ncbi:AimR family lysis-lysogeny pheromone receptor [Pontibacillus salipaludis]|uniref:Uncharacterized protein n=1 Tax=Pontibacillus salipaludis TaxID=1697394 RepID=A0ABQ1Q9B6_9BACI|nr:AimR family lysis-lysogeny pheromone receptor [Pontibacillus salipaludis]GGD19766.1 hypothetical protein GCM10011389_29280 [Pontibacillus salipaludis]
MRNEETGPICSSEQLESVRQLVGPNEPALFTVLQQLTKEYDEVTAIQLAKKFCLLCQTDENKRVGLEYLYMNGLLDEVQELVKINEQSENQINREWAYLYQFFLDRKLRNAQLIDFEAFSSMFKCSDPELDCLMLFTKVYVQADKRDFGFIESIRHELTDKMLKINNTVLRICFQLRENEMLFVYYWRNDKVDIARHYGFNILDNTLLNYDKKCYMLANLAETYTYDSYELALEYAYKAREVAKEYNLSHYFHLINQRIIPFIHAVNNNTEGIETTDVPEAAHLAAVRGEKETAIRLLESLGELTPFQVYYMGLAKDDEDLLYESYRRIIDEIGDYFFGRLPLRELKKRGWKFNEEKNLYVN